MLVTLVKVKERLGITNTDHDVFLTSQIEYISETIESYCKRKFNLGTYTQTFYKDELKERDIFLSNVYLFQYPLVSLDAVTFDGESQDVSNFRTHKESAKLTRLDGFTRVDFFRYYENVIEVTYQAGYADIPLAIQESCIALVIERFNKNQAGVEMNFGSDIQRVSMPGVLSIDFDYTLENNNRNRAFGTILGNQVNVLDQYASERRVLGDFRTHYNEKI